MLPLILDKTQDTPEVILDKTGAEFIFSGNSIPENTKKFFQPVINWIESYIKKLEYPVMSAIFEQLKARNYDQAEKIIIVVEVIVNLFDNKNPNEETVVNFKMTYFNTSSTKSILDIMIQFKQLAKNGKMLIINWYFAEQDEDMLEAGEGFSKMVRFPFNYIKY